MSAISFYIILLLNMYSYTCKNNIQRVNPVAIFNYDLSNPDKVYNLPNRLKEISGITALDASSVACIQDENGILYIYDLEKEKIMTEASFFQNGDYEGITCVDKTVYVLRSDGNKKPTILKFNYLKE